MTTPPHQTPTPAPEAANSPRARRRRGRAGLWLLLSLVLIAAAGGFGLLALTGRPLVAPQWAVARVEARMNTALAGRGHISLGSAEVVLDSHYVPRLRLRDLRFLDSTGNAVVALPEVRVALALAPLLHGQIRPVALRVSGASLTLRRAQSGAINLAVGAGVASDAPPIGSVGALLDKIDAIFAQPELSRLKRVDAEALTLTLDDARAHRVWRVSDGRATLVQDAHNISIELGFGLAGGAEEPARTVMTFVTEKGTSAARIGIRVDGVAARDIAAQSPALAWLKLIDAPISGDFRASVDASGELGPMDGALNIGKGAVILGANVRPAPFQRGKLYFTYDPKAHKITFSEASVDSRVLRIHASGQAYLKDMKGGLPRVFLAQVKFSKVMVDPEGLFQQPVRFSKGALDLRLRLDPFDVTLGQVVLLEGGQRIDAHGRLRVTDKGLAVSLDAAVDAISHSRLLALWPLGLVTKTRDWVADNVLTGMLTNVHTALRLTPGAEPRVALDYEYSGANVRIIKTLPPVEQGRGYATINDNEYTMVIEAGHITPPKGGAVDVAGSVFQVPDITLKPAPAVVHLKTDSTVTAALSLLDEPPFHFLSKAGQPVDLGQGRAQVTALIRLPLVDEIRLPDVTYKVAADLRDVRSDKVVPGRVLTARHLTLKADDAGLVISGKAHLGKAAFDGSWSQKFGPEGKGHSKVTGTVVLSQDFADEFGLGLPPGAVSGSAPANLTVTLDKGTAPAFSLTSSLAGLALSIPEIGWSKAAATPGKLEVAGTLGKPASIDRLALSAPGLSAAGKVTLNADGTLDAVSLSRVQAGSWLDAPVVLSGRGKGRPVGITIPGGSIDLRKLATRATTARGEAIPITLQLDKLQVADGLTLTDFTGSFTTSGGFNGKFGARVNGGGRVQGTVTPSSTAPGARSAIRLTSDQAGAVFASAGVFARGRGGRMVLTLVPGAAAGSYDGSLKVSNIRVKGAPALAELLSAISVVGLIEQLNGDGLVFSDVEGRFRLTPAGIEVTKGAAVGASLGVSIAGTYTFASRSLDMQGTISPLYLLNGVGALVSRQGEGLFGFNYRLTGKADNPRVSVNPLSVLMPGFLRDIFRAPKPKLEAPQ